MWQDIHFPLNYFPSPTWVGPRGVCHGCPIPGVWSMGDLQDPKMEIPTIYKAFFSGLCFREYPQKIWPYIVQYLHFRILKISHWFGIMSMALVGVFRYQVGPASLRPTNTSLCSSSSSLLSWQIWWVRADAGPDFSCRSLHRFFHCRQWGWQLLACGIFGQRDDSISNQPDTLQKMTNS